MAPECSHMTTICHFPFWLQWKHLSRLPMLWNFHLVDSKCFQIKFITNKFLFTGRCHFQLSNIRITIRFWLAGDDDYLRGATSRRRENGRNSMKKTENVNLLILGSRPDPIFASQGFRFGSPFSTLGGSIIHFEIRAQCHLVVYRSCAP
jgi:hypothetical protein